MLAPFANIFGVVLQFLYNLIGNYGWAIILFSIIVKLLMLPISIKQQKSLKKNQKIQEEMKQLQFKYKNEPEKLNQEVMALYKREGASPFSGCLSSIIQIILLFAVFLLVRQPLTYMVKMDTEVALPKIENIVRESTGAKQSAYEEINVIQYVKNIDSVSTISSEELKEQEENKEEKEETAQEEKAIKPLKEEDKSFILEYKDKINLNMDFLGIDLSQVPTQNYKDIKVLIIPILYVISSFVSIRLTSNMNKKKKTENTKLITDGNEQNNEEEKYNPMDDASKTMMWMMPIMSVSIAAIAPLGLALYWLMNNILMIIERLVFNHISKKEEEAENNA